MTAAGGRSLTPGDRRERDGADWAARAPRLVATDLDGTLLRPDGSVSPRTARALAALDDAGVPVVFVTARPHRWLVDLVPHVGRHGTALCANGASVVDVATLAVVEEHGMTPDVVRAVAARLRAVVAPAGAVHLAVERTEGFAHERGFVTDHPAQPGAPAADRIEDLLTASTLKLLVRTDPPPPPDGAQAWTDALVRAVGTLALVQDSGAHGLGEIAAPGVTKASALSRWADRHGIDAADVWAVGDAPNDLPMLAWAGTAFAVANAHPQVLEAADHVLPPNDQDGVAVLLEHAAPHSSARSVPPLSRTDRTDSPDGPSRPD